MMGRISVHTGPSAEYYSDTSQAIRSFSYIFKGHTDYGFDYERAGSLNFEYGRP